MPLNKFEFNKLKKEGKIVRRFTNDGKMGWYYKDKSPDLIEEGWQPIIITEATKEMTRIYFNPDVIYPNDLITKEIWEKIIMKDRIKFMKAMGMN